MKNRVLQSMTEISGARQVRSLRLDGTVTPNEGDIDLPLSPRYPEITVFPLFSRNLIDERNAFGELRPPYSPLTRVWRALRHLSSGPAVGRTLYSTGGMCEFPIEIVAERVFCGYYSPPGTFPQPVTVPQPMRVAP